MTVLESSAFAVAAVAAVRSTWSPCGWSVLSTMTPLAERRRGHRYLATATWYVLGATIGGLTLGGLLAGIGALGLGQLPGTTRGVALVALAFATAASDLSARLRIPGHGRQVNEDWLDLYRPSVYALGFGWQIGTGLLTYIRTAGVYLVVGFGLFLPPLTALALGGLFGLVRGLCVFLGVAATTPGRLLGLHRAFARADRPSRIGAAAAYAVTAVLIVVTVHPGGATLPQAVVGTLAVTGCLRGIAGRTRHPAVTGLRSTRGMPATTMASAARMNRVDATKT